ncbi:hypothetical protein [Flavobacterium psychrotrophum]|uniref:hypothetical protein n=1 Tax=Flavobacterium psychrotrophum TaxID=2294119 RepID=UPI000E30C100|nr:hypothetical protein [Flavobacterium psychrotrophum]
MKFLIYIVLALSLSLFSSCGSEPLTKAIPEISAYCGTKDIQVGVASAVSGKESINAYTLEVANIKAIKDGYPAALVSSQCAKLFFDALTKEQRKDKNTIRVTVKSESKSETTDYKMEDMERVGAFVKDGNKVINLIKKGKYNNMYAMADPEFVTKEAFDILVRDIFEKQKTILAKTNKIQDDGFEFLEVNGVHFVNVFAHTPIDSLSVNYKVTFTDEKNPKIAGFFIK